MSDNWVDWFELAVRSRVPEGWAWHSCERAEGGFMLKGSIPTTYKSGPKRGQRKADPATTSTYVVTDEQMRDAKINWEIATKQCHACYGDGHRTVSISATDGKKTAPCKRCRGTGSFDAANDVAIAVVTP